MKSFSVDEYHKKYGKSRQDVFFKYLQEKFGDKEIRYEYFSMLSCQDLLESLEFYIDDRKITSRGTAVSYINELGKLYARLKEDYGVNNDIYVNGNFLPEFLEAKDKIVNRLSDKNDKSIATDEQYEELVESIKKFVENIEYYQVVEGIDKFIIEGNAQAPKTFRRLCSIVALLMVLEYGCKNNVIVGERANSVDMKNSSIYINGYMMPMSDFFKNNMIKYIKARNYVLEKQKVINDYLFINPDGQSFYKPRPNYTNFFYFLNENFKSVETELFAKRRILQMMNSGIDLKLISKISGFGDTTCEKLFNINYKKDAKQEKLRQFILNNADSKMKIERKGYINCPVCGRTTKAVSNELVLIKRQNDDTLYLACKRCGGIYGK